MNPFPIIPPPTPFSGDDSEPPVVPARPPFTFTSRLGPKKTSLFAGSSRNESFSTAVSHTDIELQEMRPLKETASEPVYDVAYGEGPRKQLVEVDVHPRKAPSMMNPIVHNQLYTDVNGVCELRNKSDVFNSARSLRQVPVNTMTVSTRRFVHSNAEKLTYNQLQFELDHFNSVFTEAWLTI